MQAAQDTHGALKVVVMSLFGLEKMSEVTPLLFLQSQKNGNKSQGSPGLMDVFLIIISILILLLYIIITT